MSDPPAVDIYLIHWNAPERAAPAIGLLLSSREVAVSVTVIDNASDPDNLESLMTRLHGRVPIERLANNLGYAGGANHALAQHRVKERPGIPVLAAHDVLVEQDTLARLAAALERNSDLGIVGPGLWDPGFERPLSIGGRYHPWLGGPLIPAPASNPSHGTGLSDADFLSGSLLMIRPECLADIGGLDERLFAYWEDVDLCMRAQAAGWRTAVVLDARAAEQGYGAAFGVQAYLIARNHLLVTRWHRGPWATAVASLAIASRAVRAALGSLLLHKPAARRTTSWQFAKGRAWGLVDGLMGRGGPPPARLQRQSHDTPAPS